MSSPFEDFPNSVKKGTYWPVDHGSVLGPTAGDPLDCLVIADEGDSVSLTSQPLQEQADCLFYAESAPLDVQTCVGGYLGVNGRKYVIDGWNVSRDGETGEVNHYELTGQRVDDSASDYTGDVS